MSGTECNVFLFEVILGGNLHHSVKDSVGLAEVASELQTLAVTQPVITKVGVHVAISPFPQPECAPHGPFRSVHLMATPGKFVMHLQLERGEGTGTHLRMLHANQNSRTFDTGTRK